MTEPPGRNELARQCADLRDEIATLRERVATAEALAAKWRVWVDSVALVLEDAGVADYEAMSLTADAALDNTRDLAYDDGYRAAFSDIRRGLGEALEDFAEKQLGPPLRDGAP